MYRTIRKWNLYKVAIVFVIVTYQLCVSLFSYNMPIANDYDSLDSLCKYIESKSFKEKVNHLLSLDSEHKVLTARLILLVDHKVFGKINFIRVIFVGNLALIGIFLVIMSSIYSSNVLSPYNEKIFPIVLTIACLLFNFGASEASLSTGSSSALCVLLFVLLCLFFLIKDTLTGLLTSIFFGVIASYTFANGLFIFFVGLFYLVLNKKYKYIPLWALGMVITYYSYFASYETPSHHANPLESIKNLSDVVLYAFAFCGSAFSVGGVGHRPILSSIFAFLAVCLGFVIVAFFVFLTYKGYYRSKNIFYFFLLFIIITSFAIALSRINFGLFHALASRYHVNSNLAVVSCLILLLEYLRDKRALLLGKLVKIAPFLALAYFVLTIPILWYFSQRVYFLAKSGKILHPYESRAKDILKRASESGLYTVPK